MEAIESKVIVPEVKLDPVAIPESEEQWCIYCWYGYGNGWNWDAEFTKKNEMGARVNYLVNNRHIPIEHIRIVHFTLE